MPNPSKQQIDNERHLLTILKECCNILNNRFGKNKKFYDKYIFESYLKTKVDELYLSDIDRSRLFYYIKERVLQKSDIYINSSICESYNWNLNNYNDSYKKNSYPNLKLIKEIFINYINYYEEYKHINDYKEFKQRMDNNKLNNSKLFNN